MSIGILFHHHHQSIIPLNLIQAWTLHLIIPFVSAAGNDDTSGGPGCPTFDGVNAGFMSWLIAFCAWVAWKRPELSPLIKGTSTLPTPANPNAPTAREKSTIKKWKGLNTQLYGAIVSHVAASIQSTLHLDYSDDGVAAMQYMKNQFGAKSSGDRAEAMSRVQKSYIDSRAKISEKDITRQYTEMSLAMSDVVATGGAKLDDTLMISMFENSLPVAYAAIRQMVRYRAHTSFSDFYNDFLAQVKAEERSSQAPVNTAFTTQPFQFNSYGGRAKGRFAKGKGKAGGGRYGYVGRGKGKGQFNTEYGAGYFPCFNCGRGDHPRSMCPEAPIVCPHCGAGHVAELCSKGPGGPMRDALTTNARLAVDRATERMSRPHRAMNSWGYDNYNDYGGSSDMRHQLQAAFMLGKRSAEVSRSTDQMPAIQHQEAAESSCSTQITTSGLHGNQQRVTACAAQTSARPPPTVRPTPPDLAAIDNYINDLRYGSYLTQTMTEEIESPSALMASLHTIAYIDSQATNFVVPDVAYLTNITDSSPDTAVETANGAVAPEAVGETVISLFDDQGEWHTYHIKDVWVLPTCNKVLYSQSAMRSHGINHRLDDGFIIFENGSTKSISPQTYAIELMFGDPAKHSNHHHTVGIHRATEENPGRVYAARSSVPQKLLWQRLGCPGSKIWTNVCDMVSDHGLPPNPHLRHDFDTPEAVTRARARLLPFQRIRDPDQLPTPGAMIYMDFAGPMLSSFPHHFTYYCGAIDAGSGYARVLPCHSPTKEIARACLEVLLADIRMYMGLSHKFTPQIVISDQGSQFMSHYFQDFLASEQIVFRPAITYTPQQNAFVERMWGTRFAIARTFLKMANLSPSFHPFAIQTANWVCNRLPQPWRGNQSPAYILGRKPVSIGYLKLFGCLTRMTIPWARREGDKHFADRGLVGIYLGPSEKSPGCVVYAPSTKKFYTSRDVICYEDIRPGLKGFDSTWKDLDRMLTDKTVTDAPSNFDAIEASSEPMLSLTSSEPLHLDRQDQLAIDFSTSSAITESHRVDTPPIDAPPDSPDVEVPTYEGAETPQLGTMDTNSPRHKRPLPASDSNDPDDPQSRAYRRNLPKRSTRYQGAYYINPTEADVHQAIRNAVNMVMHSHGIPLLGDVVIYESSVGGVGRVYAVTSTTDMGDILIPRTYKQALGSPEANYWRDAITKELNGLMEIGTFEFVKLSNVPPHANIMRCHMVFTVKRQHDGSIEKFKCRLVADGNTQQWGVDFDRVFSTVAKLSTLRLVLAIAAAYDYDLSSVDIRQAYLQASLNEDLYMMVPPSLPDIDSDGDAIVVKLKRSLYGLKQAGREWHILFSSTLRKWGFLQSAIDTCLFTYYRGESLIWVVVWVDDCIIISNDPSLRSEFVEYLGAQHPTEDKGELQWVLQVKVVRNRVNRTISLSQELYTTDLLKRHGQLLTGLTRRFDSPYDPTIPLTHDQCPPADSPDYHDMLPYREVYMSLVGAYLWLANVTRPELCYIAAQLARFVSNPGMVHYRAALRVLLYLQSSSARCLEMKPNSHLPLRAFLDADWATKFSISGGLIDYMGVPVHWISRSQRSVSMSSTESEFFAASLVVKEVMFFRDLLCDLRLTQVGPTNLLTDNRGVVDLAIDPVAFKKTKHILRAAEFVRDLSARKVIKISWIAGSRNPADLFTKAFSLAPFRRLCHMLTSLSSLP